MKKYFLLMLAVWMTGMLTMAAGTMQAGLQESAKAAGAPPTPKADLSGPSAWGSNYFPNVQLVTQEGKTVKFYDDLLRDKKVLIDFIFTQCTSICPLQTAKMAQVQKLLGDRIGRDIFIYSISLDPEHDTPERLKTYARQYHAGPGWFFLTGKREDIDVVRYKLGERSDKEQHGNTVRVADVARGQWMRIPLTADTFYIATEVGKTLDPNWYAGKAMPDIEQAPHRDFTANDIPLIHGQDLFQNRCASCHTLGKGYLLAPDLKTVALRRDREWLYQYIGAPDAVRASKDPIAEQLSRENKLVMPNLGLDKIQVTELIEFLESRSGKVTEAQTKSNK